MCFRRLGMSGVALISTISILVLGLGFGLIISKRLGTLNNISVIDQAASITAKVWHVAAGTKQPELLYSVNTNTGEEKYFKNDKENALSSGTVRTSSAVENIKSKKEKTVKTKPATNNCSFGKLTQANNSVRLNEIAWMGTPGSASDEWIELKNMLPDDVALDGWKLFSENGKFEVQFSSADTIKGNRYFLMERTDDKTLPNIDADKIYSGAIPNSDFKLRLVDRFCGLVDEVEASPKWPAGDSSLKKTMERNFPGSGWHTSDETGGSPKRDNSELVTSPVVFAMQTTSSEISSNNDAATTTDIAENSSSSDSSALPEENDPTTPSDATTTQTPLVIGTGRVFISEVMAGKAENSYYEFVELWNADDHDIDLTGWSLKKKSSTGSESSFISSTHLDGLKIGIGRHILMASPKYDGSIIADLIWPSSYSLADKSNALVLYGKGGNRIDEVSWSEIPRDASYIRQSDGSFRAGIPDPQNSSS